MPRSKETPVSPAQRRLIGLILTMVVAIPFIATPMDTRIHGLAAFAFEALSILALALLLVCARWRVDKESILNFFKTGVNLPVVLFLGLCTASVALSPMKGYSLQELLRITSGCLIYLAVSYQFRHSNQLNKLVNTLLGVGAVAAVYGFYQYVTSSREQAAGMFGDHQLLGSFLMLILPFAAIVALTEKQRNRQLGAQVAVVLIAAALLVSEARSAWVGEALALMTMGGLTYLIANRERSRLQKQDMVPSIVLVLGAVALFALMWPQGDNLASRAATLTHVQTAGNFQARMNLWAADAKMIGERPLTGFGLGMYPFVQQRYTRAGNYLGSTHYVASLGEQAHSIYLQTAADLGIPGLILWLAIPVTFCVAGVRRLLTMHAGVRRNLLMGSLAAVVACSVDAFANPSWQFGQISMFLWLVMGLGVSSMIPVTRREERSSEAAEPQAIKRPVAAFVALAMAAILPTAVLASDGSRYLPQQSPNTSGSGPLPGILGGLGGAYLGATLLSHAFPGLFAAAPPLKPGETVTITVAGHPELSFTGTIDPDGTINYPPLGKVQAAGVPPSTFAQNLQSALQSANKIGATDTVTVNGTPAPPPPAPVPAQQPGQSQ